MSFRFIDRQNDLKFLEKKYSERGFQFIILHGRRRVGKTELIKEFIGNKKNGYHVSDTSPEKVLLEKLFTDISYQLEGKKLLFAGLDAFFEYIYEFSKNERVIIILDEFQYIMESIPSFNSILQKFIDERFRHSDLYLILCGSEIRIMQSLFGIKNPLYGRRTGQWKVKPFRFSSLWEFFPGSNPLKLLKIYSLTGGMPLYLNLYEEELDFTDNIDSMMLDQASKLSEEPLNLLRQEFREVSRYFGILQAIAQGKNRIVEISNYIGVEARTLPKYIINLLETDLIEKNIPVGIKVEKNKLSRYRIKDNLINFWFRFIKPHQDQIQLGNKDPILQYIIENYNKYMGYIFENVVKQLVEELNVRKLLPVQLLKVGVWWKKGVEFDLIGISVSEDEILCIEIKYGENINGPEELAILKDKLNGTLWKNKTTHLGIVSRGFEKIEVGCITFDELYQSLFDNTKPKFNISEI